jgi:hypothetical protein
MYEAQTRRAIKLIHRFTELSVICEVTETAAPKSKIQFNGGGGLRTYISSLRVNFWWSYLMSNTAVKIAAAHKRPDDSAVQVIEEGLRLPNSRPPVEIPLAAPSHRPSIMSGQIIKVSVSVAAVATSAVSLFAISWVGLALLGF